MYIVVVIDVLGSRLVYADAWSVCAQVQDDCWYSTSVSSQQMVFLPLSACLLLITLYKYWYLTNLSCFPLFRHQVTFMPLYNI